MSSFDGGLSRLISGGISSTRENLWPLWRARHTEKISRSLFYLAIKQTPRNHSGYPNVTLTRSVPIPIDRIYGIDTAALLGRENPSDQRLRSQIYACRVAAEHRAPGVIVTNGAFFFGDIRDYVLVALGSVRARHDSRREFLLCSRRSRVVRCAVATARANAANYRRPIRIVRK